MSEATTPLYEYRRYEVAPGRLPALKKRFETMTLGHFKRHGIRCVGFWESVYGDGSMLHYLLLWDSAADRETRWNAFQADPAWQRDRAETEQSGPIVANVHNELWKLTPFSPVPPAS